MRDNFQILSDKIMERLAPRSGENSQEKLNSDLLV
eukprot:CAMPEP_0113708232 /NCGR_PEP_ID=MMETSP0038_2-20120614/28855_1 /TAXON_ID=2898 /ORGANISM="Cryptomonas paramecium" /LENGTH=34 /DNA_ID=CAMNT_0000633891 /DNA_START=522 /DNA_END=626 /DNA_ORIENTATION=+ /assembly_acc=CAM_ASM_000170